MSDEENNNYIKYIDNLIVPYNVDYPNYKNIENEYYYTDQATNGQLKRLQKTNSDLNYIQFLQHENQVQYFKTFIIDKIPKNTALDMQLMYLKKELRNIDWLFLSKSGMLQDQFITLILSKNQMIRNGLIDETQFYIPIKIIHYLYPKQLCESHNLLKIVKNTYFENDNDNYSSSSDQSNSSIQQLNNGTLLQKILRILHEDRIQYSKNSLYEPNDQNNRFIETAHLKNTDYANTVQKCISDDFVQFIKTKALHTQDNSSYYTIRFSDQKYLIQNVEQPINSYVGYNLTIPKPILNFTTLDKKFTDLYHELTYEYTDNKDGSVSSSSILSTPKMHIVDQYRNCGLDRISLLKYQDNLPLDFVCKYYYMDEICKYYRFTPKQLIDNYNGLIITYKNQENTALTPLDFKSIFTYNSFDMQNEDMKSVYNRIITDTNITSDDKNEIKNIIYLYQRIVNRQSVQSSTSNVLIDATYSSLVANYNTDKATLQPNNGKFEKHFEINKNINQQKYNYKRADLIITNTDNFSDNLLLINLKNNNLKRNIIQVIQKTTQINGYNTDYCLYRYIQPSVREGMQQRYVLQNIPIPIMDIDENGHYLNLCVRCHEKQFFYVDRGTAIQNVLRPPIPLSIQNAIKNNDFYYPNNRSCDNNGYIICGLYDMLTLYTDCYTVLKAKVYFDDIIAILDNGLIACNRVKIMDSRLYYPKYNIGKQSENDSIEPYKVYIYKQIFK